MDTAILWIAVGVSVLGLLFAALFPAMPPETAHAANVPLGPGRAERLAWQSALLLGALLAGACFALTRPTAPPWSEGQGLGIGLLLGAGGALLAAGLLYRVYARVFDAPHAPSPGGLLLSGISSAVGMLSLALLPVTLAVLLGRASLLDTLNGVVLGALLVVIIARLRLGMRPGAGGALPDAAPLDGWLLFTAALAAGVAFGFRHFPAAAPAARLAPLALGSLLLVTTLLGAGLFGSGAAPGRALAAIGGLATLVTAALALVAFPRLLAVEGAAAVTLLGAGTVALVVLLFWAQGDAPSGSEGAREKEDLPPTGYGVENGALVGLMALGLFVVAFQWLRGFGVALALLGTWGAGAAALAALCWEGAARVGAARWASPPGVDVERLGSLARALHRFLGILLLFLLFRLFLERTRPLATDLSLTVHFTFVGLMVGVMAPLVLTAVLQRAARRGADGTAAWLVLASGVALWMVAVPAAVGVAWGARSLVGLLAGLIVASVTALSSAGPVERRDAVATLPLLAMVGLATVMIQGAHLLSPLGILERPIRVGVLLSVALAGLLWVAVAARVGGKRR